MRVSGRTAWPRESIIGIIRYDGPRTTQPPTWATAPVTISAETRLGFAASRSTGHPQRRPRVAGRRRRGRSAYVVNMVRSAR